ncbi:MAG: F0F1 ATP synthase subunit B [Candidatus Levybacteria bacterium]|nr:F0F1 ATP synthase subunit B [Candidatus Levybacteria bacterium]
MEFLKSLGFDPIMLGAQILNFLIIFYLLKRFLYKPVMDMVKKREDKITLGLKQAQEAQELMEKTLVDEKKILTKAQDEAKKIIEETKEESRQIASNIQEEAKVQAEKMLTQMRTQLDQDTRQMEKALMEKVSVLAADMLTKSLQGMLTESEQKEIVQKAVKQIKKVN